MEHNPENKIPTQDEIYNTNGSFDTPPEFGYIKKFAIEAVRQQRGTAILIVFLNILIVAAGGRMFHRISPPIGSLLVLATVFFIDMPLWVKVCGQFVKIYSKEKASAEGMFSGFFDNYWRKVGAMAVVTIPRMLVAIPMLATGWAVHILMLPLAVAALYAWTTFFMTVFILEQHPNVTAIDALKLSVRMTNGHKGKLFSMLLGFFGWALPVVVVTLIVAYPFLTALTAGHMHPLVALLLMAWMFMLVVVVISIYWILFLGPRWFATYAGYCIVLKNRALASGIVKRHELEGCPEETEWE